MVLRLSNDKASTISYSVYPVGGWDGEISRDIPEGRRRRLMRIRDLYLISRDGCRITFSDSDRQIAMETLMSHCTTDEECHSVMTAVFASNTSTNYYGSGRAGDVYWQISSPK